MNHWFAFSPLLAITLLPGCTTFGPSKRFVEPLEKSSVHLVSNNKKDGFCLAEGNTDRCSLAFRFITNFFITDRRKFVERIALKAFPDTVYTGNCLEEGDRDNFALSNPMKGCRDSWAAVPNPNNTYKYDVTQLNENQGSEYICYQYRYTPVNNTTTHTQCISCTYIWAAESQRVVGGNQFTTCGPNGPSFYALSPSIQTDLSDRLITAFNPSHK